MYNNNLNKGLQFTIVSCTFLLANTIMYIYIRLSVSNMFDFYLVKENKNKVKSKCQLYSD